LSSVDVPQEAGGGDGVRAPGVTRNGVDAGAGDLIRVGAVHGSIVHHAPGGRSAPPVPRQLPHDVRGLAGREEQLRRLDRMLHQGTDAEAAGGTIAVVSGMAGIGKTALALRWAHGVRAGFPDGELYADLCGSSVEHPESATRVLGRFLRALGIPDSRVPPDLHEKACLYRRLLAGRRVLVVLDDAATAAQVRPLLPGNSDCAVVITSRNRLADIEGAGHLTLEPLRHQDAVSLLRNMLQDRADDDADLGDLAAACARLPLALRIAAQRAAHRPMTPLTDLLAALRDSTTRRRALSMENGDVAEAVHGVFAWSYCALPPATARFFRLLGLHPGPDLRIEAAAALAGVTPHEARAAMGVLADAHLVEQSCAGRYRMHDLVNAYAKDRAEAQESAAEIEAARRRVLEWYLQGSYAASRFMDHSNHFPMDIELSGAATGVPEILDRRTASLWYDQEWANIVAAIESAAERGYREFVWQLAATVRLVFLQADRRDAGFAVLDMALRATRNLGDLRAEGTILDGLAHGYGYFGQREARVEAYDAAIAIWRELGDRYREAIGRTTRSLEMYCRRDWGSLVPYIEETIALAEGLGERSIYARNRGNLAECMLELGRLPEARTMAQEALAIHRDHAWSLGIADSLWNLSRVLRASHRMDKALPHAIEAVTQAKRTTDAFLQGRTMLELAVVLQGNRRYDDAMTAYQKSLDHSRLAGDRGGEARVLERVAVLYHERGILASARVSHELSIDISRAIDDRWFLALSLERFAETMERLGRSGDARAARTESLGLFKGFDEPAAHVAGDRLSAILGIG
jgi:tetratricopeptide (TPR) repeat protein